MEFTTRKTTSKSLTNGKPANGKWRSRLPPSVINLDTTPSTICGWCTCLRRSKNPFDSKSQLSSLTPNNSPILLSHWFFFCKLYISNMSVDNMPWIMKNAPRICRTNTNANNRRVAGKSLILLSQSHHLHSMRRFKHSFKSPTNIMQRTNTHSARTFFPLAHTRSVLNYKFMNRLFTCQVDSRNL